MLKKHPNMIMIGHSAAFWSEISDYPLELHNDYQTGKMLNDSMISQTNYEKIVRLNAVKLLGLDK